MPVSQASTLSPSFLAASTLVAKATAEQNFKAAQVAYDTAYRLHYDRQTAGSSCPKRLRDAASSQLEIATIRLDIAKKALAQCSR